MSVMNEALSDLRAALAAGEDRETAITEIATEHGVKRPLLARFAETMATTALPTAAEAGLDKPKRNHVIETPKNATAEAEARIAAMSDDEINRMLEQCAHLEDSASMQRTAKQFLKARTGKGQYLDLRIAKASEDLQAKLHAELERRK